MGVPLLCVGGDKPVRQHQIPSLPSPPSSATPAPAFPHHPRQQPSHTSHSASAKSIHPLRTNSKRRTRWVSNFGTANHNAADIRGFGETTALLLTLPSQVRQRVYRVKRQHSPEVYEISVAANTPPATITLTPGVGYGSPSRIQTYCNTSIGNMISHMAREHRIPEGTVPGQPQYNWQPWTPPRQPRVQYSSEPVTPGVQSPAQYSSEPGSPPPSSTNQYINEITTVPQQRPACSEDELSDTDVRSIVQLVSAEYTPTPTAPRRRAVRAVTPTEQATSERAVSSEPPGYASSEAVPGGDTEDVSVRICTAIEQSTGRIVKREIKKALKEMQRSLRREMKEMKRQAGRASKELRRGVRREMKDMKRQARRASKELRRGVRREMKDMRRDMRRELKMAKSLRSHVTADEAIETEADEK